MARVLVHFPASIWSERARWVLDYHRVPHRRLEHVPMLFELPLRVATRDLQRPITVPIFFDDGLVLRDSLAIARHVDKIGHNAPLFPDEVLSTILAWNDLAERLADAGRSRAMDRLLESPAALAELVPSPLAPLGSALRPLAKLGAQYVVQKHHTRAHSRAEREAQMVSALDGLSEAIARRPELAGDHFSYADIACATSLGFVRPHAGASVGPATREVYTEPGLAERYAPVLAWRDTIVERYRGAPPASSR